MTFAGDVKDLFELPPGAKDTFVMHSPWKQDREASAVTLKGGQSYVFQLKPFEVLVLEETSKNEP